METPVDPWSMIGALAAIGALPLAAIPAWGALRDWLSRKTLRDEIVRKLMPEDTRDVTTLPTKKEKQDFVEKHSRSLPYLTGRITDRSASILSTITNLIKEGKIALWLKDDKPISDDTVIDTSSGNTQTIRAVRPRFFLEPLPNDLRQNLDQKRIDSILHFTGPKRRWTRRLSISFAISLIFVAAMSSYYFLHVNTIILASTQQTVGEWITCPGRFFSGSEANGTLPVTWDLAAGTQQGARSGTIRSFCDASHIIVNQLTISDGNRCTFWGEISGKNVAGTYQCPNISLLPFSGTLRETAARQVAVCWADASGRCPSPWNSVKFFACGSGGNSGFNPNFVCSQVCGAPQGAHCAVTAGPGGSGGSCGYRAASVECFE
jgi:hypothetical protein